MADLTPKSNIVAECCNFSSPPEGDIVMVFLTAAESSFYQLTRSSLIERCVEP